MGNQARCQQREGANTLRAWNVRIELTNKRVRLARRRRDRVVLRRLATHSTRSAGRARADRKIRGAWRCSERRAAVRSEAAARMTGRRVHAGGRGVLAPSMYLAWRGWDLGDPTLPQHACLAFDLGLQPKAKKSMFCLTRQNVAQTVVRSTPCPHRLALLTALFLCGALCGVWHLLSPPAVYVCLTTDVVPRGVFLATHVVFWGVCGNSCRAQRRVWHRPVHIWLNASMTGIVAARCDPAAAQWATVRVRIPVKMTE
eukprot:354887-Chlamydomonas_euryale.AAC.2